MGAQRFDVFLANIDQTVGRETKNDTMPCDFT